MFERVLANAAADAKENESAAAHALLARREEMRIQLVLITSDRGLAGAFNTNLIRAASQFIAEHHSAVVEIEAIGRKGRDFFRRRGAALSGEYLGLKASFSEASEIAHKVARRFATEEVDAVYLLFNEFRTVLSQRVGITKVLPLKESEKTATGGYLYEQPPEKLLESLLPRYVEVSVYQALLESTAAEHAARMTAMDAASSNASQVIDKLTLTMNRVRQASITKEIIEVVSGAAALE
jgi:F-type H+-transporting ATPase subunit gamma